MQASSLDLAQKNSDSYKHNQHFQTTAQSDNNISEKFENLKLADDESVQAQVAAAYNSTTSKNKCFFCGNSYHPRHKCPARDVECNKCGKKGHFSKVCLSSKS
jgi:hypothetical protein